jgi:Holliday junction DNA helicase RuvB
VAHELGVNIKESSGPVIEKPGDLPDCSPAWNPAMCLFIDEIHRLSTVVEE